MIKTLATLPLQIMQYFSSALLSNPYPKFCDDSEALWKIYQWIKRKLEKKCKTDKRIEKFQKLEKQFLELYERAKKKEEDLKAKTGNANKGPFYYFGYTDKYHKGLSRRLGNKRYKAY
jgi:hypothetical protein